LEAYLALLSDGQIWIALIEQTNLPKSNHPHKFQNKSDPY